MDYEIQLHQRPGKDISEQIVDIAKLLTGKWFTSNVPGDIEKDLLFHDALCLVSQGKIISFLVFTSLDGSINILLMGTHPDFIGKGFGSILIRHFFQYIKSIGFHRIVVFTVPPDTKPSYDSTVKFYQKHGFEIKKRYNELWESGAIELVKEMNVSGKFNLKAPSGGTKMLVEFTVDLKGETTPFPHYWEQCVGSCHAYMGLREDWRKQLKICHDELGFQYVRFHGLLNDTMSVCTRRKSGDGKAEIRYSFFNIGSIFDFLLEIGMKPFIELGFMPEILASGTDTCFHYKGNITPPADYEQWETLILRLVRFLVDRYGVDEVRTWFFEVWNEPNLRFFWAGTKEEYFKLYQHTAKAIKSIDSQLRVGGPATSVNAWIPDFIAFCQSTGTPVDFISTHHYPTDDPLWKSNILDMEEFFQQFGDGLWKYERGILYKMTQKAKAEAGDLPLYYTEWNTSAMLPDPIHDESYSAALIAKTIADNAGLVEGYSFWTFSDLFEEQGQYSQPFHGGFGLLTIHGIPKPTYRVFELLHQLGERRLMVKGDPGVNVEMMATMEQKPALTNTVKFLIYNHNISGAPIQAEEVCIHLIGLASGQSAILFRIDASSANPKKKWVELGSQEYPAREVLREIHQASLPVRVELKPEFCNGDWVLRFMIPPHGVVGIELEC
jgi:xylan 1,4-beta-xylosidase